MKKPTKTAIIALFAFLFFTPVTVLGGETGSNNSSKSTTTRGQSAEAQSQPAASGAQTDDHIPFMSQAQGSADADQPSPFGLLIRTLGALLLVIGLLVAFVWVLRRLKEPGIRGAADDQRLTVLQSISIGEKKALTVVRFGEKLLLLGSTQQSVTLLASNDIEDSFSDEQVSVQSMSPMSVAETLRRNEAPLTVGSPRFSEELERFEQAQYALDDTTPLSEGAWS